MKKLFLIVLILTASVGFAQSYSMPNDLSPYGVATWTIRGGQIASGSATPTGAGVDGMIYIDVSTASTPLMYRHDGSAWQALSGAGDATNLNAHVASGTDPHGATMAVSLELTVGSGTVAGSIYSPAAGQIMISSYAVLLTLPSAPAAASGAIYFDANGHFYGCDGTTWTQLDN